MLGDEIATYLAGAGLGLSLSSTSGGVVFGVPFPPEAPDTACCVIEYGGGPPLDAFGASLSAPVYEQPRFQVLCRDRSDNAATCRALANSIYKALRHFSGTLGGVSYGSSRRSSRSLSSSSMRTTAPTTTASSIAGSRSHRDTR